MFSAISSAPTGQRQVPKRRLWSCPQLSLRLALQTQPSKPAHSTSLFMGGTQFIPISILLCSQDLSGWAVILPPCARTYKHRPALLTSIHAQLSIQHAAHTQAWAPGWLGLMGRGFHGPLGPYTLDMRFWRSGTPSACSPLFNNTGPCTQWIVYFGWVKQQVKERMREWFHLVLLGKLTNPTVSTTTYIRWIPNRQCSPDPLFLVS